MDVRCSGRATRPYGREQLWRCILAVLNERNMFRKAKEKAMPVEMVEEEEQRVATTNDAVLADRVRPLPRQR